MKKKMIKTVCLSIGLAFSLTACASPEDEIIGGRDNENTNQAFETSEAKVLDDKSSVIHVDDGRHITATYGADEYVFQIDADVVVPQQAIVKGVLELKKIDISLIEQYLCDGDELVWDNATTSYISETDTVENDNLTYDRSFFVTGSDAVFEDFTKDKYYDSNDRNIGIHMIEEADWTDEDKSFIETMADQADDLLKQLQLDTEYSHAWLETSDNNSYCEVYENVLLESAPMVSKSYGTFIQNCVQIGEYGIDSIHFSGLYDVNTSENVSNMMSLDDVLKFVQQGVEEKNINTLKYSVDSIQLAYMFDENKMTFTPVWCFSISEPDYGYIPALCIDAISGEILLMM